ncbi:hypothetical protein D3C83_226920 [compost metagenome]
MAVCTAERSTAHSASSQSSAAFAAVRTAASASPSAERASASMKYVSAHVTIGKSKSFAPTPVGERTDVRAT